MGSTGVRAAVLTTGVIAALLMAGPARAGDDRKARSPEVIDADDVSHRPDGYRTETRARRGPITTGAVMTGAGCLMILAGLEAKSDASGTGPGSGGELMYIPGTVIAGIGLPVLIYGLLSPRTVYVRDSEPRLSLALSPRGNAGAVSLRFRF